MQSGVVQQRSADVEANDFPSIAQVEQPVGESRGLTGSVDDLCAASFIVGFGVGVNDDQLSLQCAEKQLADVVESVQIEWKIPWKGIHDVHVLQDSNIMLQQRNRKAIEIDLKTKQVVWTFDLSQTFGNSVPNSQLLDVDGEFLR